MSDEKMIEAFGALGFEFWNTGGACTAFARNFVHSPTDAYVMITDDADCSFAPTDATRKFMVGIYDEEDMMEGEIITVDCSELDDLTEIASRVWSAFEKHANEHVGPGWTF